VYAGKVRKVRGALTLFALPSARPHPRLGLAVGTRVGGAVVRNRWKRTIREAFRLNQHGLPRSTPEGAEPPGSYDFIVSVRCPPGTRPWPLAAVAKALLEMAHDADREWRRRTRRDAPDSSALPPPGPSP
jgi:hypothetical protein